MRGISHLPEICNWEGVSQSQGVIAKASQLKGRHYCAACSLAGTAYRKLYSGCQIYGIKWLARSHTRWKRWAWDSLYLQLCCFGKWVSEEPLAVHMLTAWSVLQFPSWDASMLTMSPRSCVGFQRTGWNSRSPWPGHDLYFLWSPNKTTT